MNSLKERWKKALKDPVWWICVLVLLVFIFFEEILDIFIN
jgi:hypothetical protein